ncbi:hypothetical protein [Paracidovorax wautersii]|uniref:Zinc-ribbon domain-containing protein n=1 Tax=Paracidovorax wautersii TaxID=1177982 RepID=A0A1I2E854_9BURK|nr:hypothetical protein [Paracidovorax wautersii]SFE88440.1 hypothetical protein SAMN04489711_106259 [Paracidovorax wautersii]
MKPIVCPTCKTTVAADAQACPSCSHSFLHRDKPPNTRTKDTPPWAWILSFALVGSLLLSCLSNSSPRETGPLKDYEALALCQEKIKSASLDRSAAVVPYVENMGTGSEFYFAWGAQTTYARLRNAAGLEAPASASCIVNAGDRRIIQLTINGKTLI